MKWASYILAGLCIALVSCEAGSSVGPAAAQAQGSPAPVVSLPPDPNQPTVGGTGTATGTGAGTTTGTTTGTPVTNPPPVQKPNPDPAFPITPGGQPVLPPAGAPFVSPLFSDHMVLQHDNPILFGWTTPGAPVTGTIQELAVHASTTADANGRWMISFPAQAAGGPYHVQISGQTQRVLQDVLLGEVWLCAGSSNASMAFNDMLHDTGYGVVDQVYQNLATSEIVNANNTQVRLYQMLAAANPNAQQALPAGGTWTAADAVDVSTFSALGYLFGRDLQQTLRIPVGVMQVTYVETYIREWVSPGGLARVSGLQDSNTIARSDIFNTMVSPLAGYGLAGVIWYQGENDQAGPDVALFAPLLTNLKGSWRQLIGNGSLPFLVVQLASEGNAQVAVEEPNQQLMQIREAQRQATAADSFGVLVTAIDLGDSQSTYPANKWDLATRLSSAAVASVYQMGGVGNGPMVQQASVQGSSITITFTNPSSGLVTGNKIGISPVQITPGAALNGFSVGDATGTWVQALAQIQGTSSVVVTAPTIAVPVTVRYDWGANPGGNLYNGSSLPAVPFALPVSP